jgi:hypothetical protein
MIFQGFIGGCPCLINQKLVLTVNIHIFKCLAKNIGVFFWLHHKLKQQHEFHSFKQRQRTFTVYLTNSIELCNVLDIFFDNFGIARSCIEKVLSRFLFLLFIFIYGHFILFCLKEINKNI